MKVCLYLSVLCNKLVLSAWCAYIQVLPTISLYALKIALKFRASEVKVGDTNKKVEGGLTPETQKSNINSKRAIFNCMLLI